MSINEIIATIMSSCGMTQEALAELADYSSQAAVSSRLNTRRMSVSTALRLLGGLGAKMYVEYQGERWEVE